MGMIDITAKTITKRVAQASGQILLSDAAADAIRQKTNPKGDVFTVAEITALQAAKNCSLLLPLCHPLAIEHVSVKFELSGSVVNVKAQVACFAKTGVEMEALVAVQSALLCIYDMSKIIDPAIELGSSRLDWKIGGKSGVWVHPHYMGEAPQIPGMKSKNFSSVNALVITLSDRAAKGEYPDTSGPAIAEILTSMNVASVQTALIPDEPAELQRLITESANIQLIVTTGGTGVSSRDQTPDTLKQLFDREIPGVGELLRSEGAVHTPLSWASRSIAGVVGDALVVALPGRESAVRESMDSLRILLPHLVAIVRS